MADNTRMKELKKNVDAINLVGASMSAQIERLEVVGHAQMAKMEEIQRADDQTITIVTEVESKDDETHHFYSNTMRGSHGVGIIRFTGQVGSIMVKILVDGGSSDNFIQPRGTQVLKLLVEPVLNLRVLVGNGEILSAGGIIQ
ncbi:hypothetical protein KIW84_041337 [Lathyrus oleraceus]|uniref:Uncharacterized protein n=1 Tax=Pisum sativum TaxID=3888 RepID=A0A9D4X8B0_PEA|nr:hypothetical protein KIW84_041337 [Pisum sativum]